MSDLSLDDLDGDSLPQSGDRLQILSPELAQNPMSLFVPLLE
jgi:hypothetical protein